MRILIVEDDLVSQIFMKTVLNKCGQCAIASDGEEAVKLFIAAATNGCPFDVVFMDIMLPKMDGLTAIDKIREYEGSNPRHAARPTHVVVVTATGDSQNIIHAYRSGDVFAYLKKPLEQNVLEATLAKITSMHAGTL